MSTATSRPEFRTPEQIRADNEIADSFERYLVVDATTRWTVLEASDERRRLAGQMESNATSNAVAPGGLDSPFVWNGKAFRIERATFAGGKAEVVLTPSDPQLEAEMRRRIERVPHHVLTFYQGFGFICFPEDYQRYSS